MLRLLRLLVAVRARLRDLTKRGTTWAPSAMCCSTSCAGSFLGKDDANPRALRMPSVVQPTQNLGRNKPSRQVSWVHQKSLQQLVLVYAWPPRKKRKKRIGKRKAATSHQDLCKSSWAKTQICEREVELVDFFCAAARVRCCASPPKAFPRNSCSTWSTATH